MLVSIMFVSSAYIQKTRERVRKKETPSKKSKQKHSPPPTTFGFGKNLSSGRTFSALMYTLSPGLKEEAWTPAESSMETEK